MTKNTWRSISGQPQVTGPAVVVVCTTQVSIHCTRCPSARWCDSATLAPSIKYNAVYANAPNSQLLPNIVQKSAVTEGFWDSMPAG